MIRLIWYPYWYTFLPFYDRHKCQKMSFYDIYDGHKMSSNDIKVWQYGYQIDRLELNILVMINVLEHIWLVRRNTQNENLKNIPYLVPFIKFNLVAYRHFWSFRADFLSHGSLYPYTVWVFLHFQTNKILFFGNTLLPPTKNSNE